MIQSRSAESSNGEGCRPADAKEAAKQVEVSQGAMWAGVDHNDGSQGGHAGIRQRVASQNKALERGEATADSRCDGNNPVAGYLAPAAFQALQLGAETNHAPQLALRLGAREVVLADAKLVDRREAAAKVHDALGHAG